MTRRIMSTVRTSILCAFSCSSWMWNVNEVICRSGSFRMKVFSVTCLLGCFFGSPLGCLLFLHLFSREDSLQPSLHVVVRVYVFMLRHRRRTAAWSHSVLSTPVTVRAEGSWQSWSDSWRRRDAFAPLSVWTLRSALLDSSAPYEELNTAAAQHLRPDSVCSHSWTGIYNRENMQRVIRGD